MKRVLASSTPLALVLMLLVATASRGQQGEDSGQPGQPAQPGANQRGKGDDPNRVGQQQSGQSGNSGQSGMNQPGQPGNPNQAAQPQHNNRPGQPGQDPWANHQAAYRDLGQFTPLLNSQLVLGTQWRNPGWSEGANGQGMVFAFVDNASRNSGMTLAPADAALRAQLKLGENQGLIVTQIEPGSPAAAAGVRQNDLLVRLEGEDVQAIPLGKVEDLENALKEQGERVVSLVLMRSGRQESLKVQPRVHASLGPVRPEPPAYWIGVSVSPVEPALRAQLQLPDNQGLIVMEVDPHGPATKAGVRKFDIIRSFNGLIPADQSALTKLVQSHGEKTVVVELLREARPLHVKLVPERRHSLGRRLSAELPSQTLYRVNLLGDQKGPVLGTMAFDPNGNLVGNVFADFYSQKIDTPADPALTKRLDDLTAQIRELRQAVEAMTKAQSQGQGNR